MNLVNYRVKNEYMSEDGRRVEVWSLAGKVKQIEDIEEEVDSLENKELFYGILVVGTPIGPKEVKFSIAKVSSIEEAFDKYSECAEKTIEELKKRENEMRMAQSSKIVTAPSETLSQINAMGAANTNKKIAL